METYFEEVRRFLTERLTNHTYINIIDKHEWCNEFTEFELFTNDFGVLMLYCQNIELSVSEIFLIPVPATIIDLEKVLILLNAI